MNQRRPERRVIDWPRLVRSLDAVRRDRAMTWRAVGRAIDQSPATMSRLYRGSAVSADALAALLVWASITDIVPYLLRPPSARPDDEPADRPHWRRPAHAEAVLALHSLADHFAYLAAKAIDEHCTSPLYSAVDMWRQAQQMTRETAAEVADGWWDEPDPLQGEP